MIWTKRLGWTCAAFTLAMTAGTAAVRAQEAPTPVAQAPAPTATPSLLDREYDGATHITLTPYVWLPTLKGDFQFAVPTFGRRGHHGGGVIQGSSAVGPNQYVGNINSAAMFAADLRKGNFDVFGDYIYTNVSASANAAAVITGPRGRVQVPVNLSLNSRFAARIWEVAAGYTLARGHNADLSMFAGLRQTPLNVTLSYSATIGNRGIIAPSGTIANGGITNDVIWGLRGQFFFGDGHWFVPYYGDIGTAISSINNQSWQAYGGVGYGFNHGQTLVATYRSLSYNAFPPTARIQKMNLYGPLLGYSFNL